MQVIKFPTLRTTLPDFIKFMQYHNFPIPFKLPPKAVMLKQFKEAGLTKQLAIDKLAESYGHEVLRLPPYYCVLNPIQLVWAHLKKFVRKQNISPTLSASVCELLWNGISAIGSKLWSSCIQHTIKKENEYYSYICSTDTERFVIDMDESDDE